MSYVMVGLGGALGALLRYGLGGWVQSQAALHATAVFPWGTLAVNALGSLIIGGVMQLSTERALVSPEARLLLTTGFCGGLTTFSTFSLETLMLLRDQQWSWAAGNAVLNVALCLVATYFGFVLARAV